MDDRTAANLNRYRWHARAVGSVFWLPTVILYFVDEVGLDRALQMQAVYYASVVVFEVPSGWFSDRVGRVTTLRITASAWVLASVCFLLGGLGPIIAGQMLLALGYASLSGTDVTFLYDTLDAAGDADRFEAEEARAREGSLYLTAFTALAGGWLGFVDLRLPFVATLVVAVVQLAITLRMDEPPRRDPIAGVGWRADAVAVAQHLRTRTLGWITIYVVAEVILIHLASEFASPFAAATLDRPADDPAGAAVIAGIIVAGAAVVGALTLRGLGPATRRIGTIGVLVGAGLISATIVVLMAASFAVWVLPFLAIRGLQASVTAVLIPAIVGRRVEAERRATTLSVMSLCGRGTYAGVLVGLSLLAGSTLGRTLDAAAVTAGAVAVTVVVAVALLRPDLGHERANGELGDRRPRRRHLGVHGRERLTPERLDTACVGLRVEGRREFGRNRDRVVEQLLGGDHLVEEPDVDGVGGGGDPGVHDRPLHVALAETDVSDRERPVG